jgi:hypothetical protein
MMSTHRYRPLRRPSSCTFADVHWDYVEAPVMGGLVDWFGLPQSRHAFGVIRTDRELTAEECKRFDLEPQ